MGRAARLGVGRGEVVSYLLPNLPETHFTLWGAEAAGIVNPVNPFLEVDHMVGILNAAGSVVIVAILWFFLKDGASHSSVGDVFTGTVNNTGLNLTFAFDYGGQEEIANAARELARAAKEGRLDPETITPELFASRLFTGGLPEPDLLIRTGGEHRLSNFLLWQSSYAELLFVDTLWPDFGRKQLLGALENFAQRERQFGGLSDKVA